MTDPVTKKPIHFRSVVAKAERPQVVRNGGVFASGLIENVSIITKGEALGHELWIDHDFLSDVTGSINSLASGNRPGLKARFTHPGLSSDGVGQKLGRVRNARIEGDQVLADLHFQHASTKTPDGDLADYVMTLAEETPEDFGVSIVFDHNLEAVEDHVEENTTDGDYVSPDELNINNFVHAQLDVLRSADVVDSPAANPDGLFCRGQEAAIEGEQILEYALGLSDVRPSVSRFNADPDRIMQFVQRFLERHELSLQKGGNPVSEETSSTDVVDAPTRDDYTAELGRYVSAFGNENGTQWFIEGVAFSDALQKHNDEINAQNRALTAKVQELEEAIRSLDLGDSEGTEFAEGKDEAPKERSLSGRIQINGRQN